MFKKLTIILIIPVALVAGIFLFRVQNNKEIEAAAAPREGLVGYWTLNQNDINGTTAYDRSGNGFNATLTSSPTNATGKIREGLNFASSAYLNIPYTATTSLYADNAITFSAWVKPNTDPAAYDCIVGTTTNGGFNNGYALYWIGNSWRFFVNLYTSNVAFTAAVYPASDRNWRHIVGTYDKNAGSNQINIYVDGVKGTPGTLAVPISYGASPPFTIGKCGGYAQYFKSIIDDVRIYNRALSAQEVANLYNSAKTSFAQAPVRASSTPVSGGKLVGWWTMDANDTSSLNIYDKSGQGNTANAQGTAIAAGKINQARNQTSNTAILLNSNVVLGSSSSLSIWFQATAAPPIMIAGKSTDALPYVYFLNATSIALETDTGAFASFSFPAINIGTWNHLVVTRSGGTSRIYLNGVESTSGGQSLAGDITINEFGAYGGAAYYWRGLFDDVRIYNYALSAQDVANLYNAAAQKYTAAPPRQGLVGWWTLDQNDIRYAGTATTTFDKSGNQNTGTFSIGANTYGATSTQGRIGQALNFDGQNDQILISDPGTNSILDITSTITISAWGKWNTGGSNGDSYLLGKGTDMYDLLVYQADNGKVTFYATGLSSPYSVKTNGAYNDNKWHLFTGTYDSAGGSNNMKIYVDGALENQATRTGTISTDNVSLGIGVLGAATGYRWNGSLDDVRIYNRVLSAAEVSALYQSAAKNYVK